MPTKKGSGTKNCMYVCKTLKRLRGAKVVKETRFRILHLWPVGARQFGYPMLHLGLKNVCPILIIRNIFPWPYDYSVHVRCDSLQKSVIFFGSDFILPVLQLVLRVYNNLATRLQFSWLGVGIRLEC